MSDQETILDPVNSSEPIAEKIPEKILVNPIALQNCTVKRGDASARILDISFVRAVIAPDEGWADIVEGEMLSLDFQLDRYGFPAQASLKSRGDGWIRLAFEKFVPSSRSQLRSFLSPKKVGESLLEDWRTETVRHYHGLNESELWFEPAGAVLFTYLDQIDFESQFLIRLLNEKSPLQVGKIGRKAYIEMNGIDKELPLTPLTDREIYAKLGECRDIVTNFRPNGQVEYNLKQRLLKVISDCLYSTSYKVDLSPPRPPRVTSMPMEQ